MVMFTVVVLVGMVIDGGECDDGKHSGKTCC